MTNAEPTAALLTVARADGRGFRVPVPDDPMSPEQARELARELIEAAGDLDGTPLAGAEGGEYRMSTRTRADEQPDDGEFLDDFTSGRPD